MAKKIRADATQKRIKKIKKQIRDSAVKGVLFVRFLDGNIGNNQAKNLEWVLGNEAFLHLDDWVFDWDAELSEQDRDFAHRHLVAFEGMTFVRSHD